MLHTHVPIARHASAESSPEMPRGLDASRLVHASLGSVARREGRVELGTLGRGNHFLEIQLDESSRAWLMVHSGSRAVGQAVLRAYEPLACRATGGIGYVDAEREVGAAYLRDAGWALEYAAGNRRAMMEAASALVSSECGLSAEWSTFVDCSHNHVRREEIAGESLLIHRKGASPAHDGEAGLIPGAMGRESFHVVGRGVAAALCSSSHGAGRVMSRTDARRLVSSRRLADDSTGTAFDGRLAEGLREEAASAYKDIRLVMRAQRELVKITRRLRGVVCYKGV